MISPLFYPRIKGDKEDICMNAVVSTRHLSVNAKILLINSS